MKKRFADHLLKNCMWKRFPQLREKLRFMDVGTGLSTNYYLGALHGESYGLTASAERLRFGHRTLTAKTVT